MTSFDLDEKPSLALALNRCIAECPQVRSPVSAITVDVVRESLPIVKPADTLGSTVALGTMGTCGCLGVRAKFLWSLR